MRFQVLMCVLAALWASGCSAESVVQAQFELEVAFPALQFSQPVDLQHAGDGSDRLFVVEQGGLIHVFANDPAATAAIFLDISDRVNGGGEQGLLGLAFHPNYADNGLFFVSYTASNPRRSVVARYRVAAADANRGDRDSEVVIIEAAQPLGNHNGGQIAFGPDGLLYIALGDGGGANDQFGNGQNRTTLLGAFLRLDVDNPDANRAYSIPADNPFAGNTMGFREEIYAYGLRNPWRFSFDPATGLLWTADVGQNRFEEIDLIENGGNYGWNDMEGFECFRPLCDPTGLALPIHAYAHNGAAKSVTGGYVYRGPGVPELTGRYVYADFIDGRIWALGYDGQQVTQNTLLLNSALSIASFGVDQEGELYICAFDGRIYRFMPTTTAIAEAGVPEASARLLAPHPNPFRTATTITYALQRAAPVELVVYDAHGRRVRTLATGLKQTGEHALRWDGRTDAGMRSAGGVYFLRLLVAGVVATSRQMVLVR